jgi:hypothetical protein
VEKPVAPLPPPVEKAVEVQTPPAAEAQPAAKASPPKTMHEKRRPKQARSGADPADDIWDRRH